MTTTIDNVVGAEADALTDTSRPAASPTDTSFQAEQPATGRIASEDPQSLAVQEPQNTRLTKAISSSSLKKFIPRHKKTRSEGGSQRRKIPGRDTTDLRKTLSAVDPPTSRWNDEEHMRASQDNDNNLPDAFRSSDRIASMSRYDPKILQHQLIAALEKDFSTKKDFMPRRVLDRIISQDTVNEELSKFEYLPRRIRHRTWRKTSYVRIGSSEDREVTGCDDTPLISKPGDPAYYQLIFSILTYMGRSRKIWSFVNEGISDQCLPLFKQVVRGEKIELRRHDAPKIGLKCLKKPKDVVAFAELQWHFFVPLFGKVRDNRIVHCKARERQILPFIDWRDKGRCGAFGSVYQAKVHEDHHGFNAVSVGVIRVPLSYPEH